MIYKTIQKLEVSSIVLGTDTFGSITSETDAFSLMDCYREFGGNTIDTARVYGCHNGCGCGVSEQTVGKWLADRKGRDKVCLLYTSRCV